MEKSTTQAEYVYELDFLRGLAIIGVVLIHVVTQAIHQQGVSNFTIQYAMFWNQLSRFCVPTFIAISGILLTYRNPPGKFRYFLYLKQRAVNLLVPYLLWTLFSILNLHKWGRINPGWIRQVVWTGWGYFYQLYFIPLIFQFYILSPIFLWSSRKKRAIPAAIISITINLLFLTYYRQSYLGLLPSTEFTQKIFAGIQSNFLAWIGYFMLGCVIGEQIEKWREFVTKIPWWILGLAYALTLVWLLRDYWHAVSVTSNLMSPGENFMRPVVFWYSIVTIILLWKVAISWPSARIIHSLGNYSFGIYLVHLVFHNILHEFRNGVLYNNWIGATIAAGIVLTASYLFTWIISKDKDGWVLVGKTKHGNITT